MNIFELFGTIAVHNKSANKSIDETANRAKGLQTKMVGAFGKIGETVVDGYKKIEDGVVGGYKKIEDGVVEGFNKVSDKFVEKLFTKEGETVEDAKKRLSGKE